MSTLLIGGNGLIGPAFLPIWQIMAKKCFLTAFILPAKSIRVFITFRAT